MQAVTEANRKAASKHSRMKVRQRTKNGGYSVMEASVMTRSSAATLEESYVGRNRQKSEMTHNPIRQARTQDKKQSPKYSLEDKVEF